MKWGIICGAAALGLVGCGGSSDPSRAARSTSSAGDTDEVKLPRPGESATVGEGGASSGSSRLGVAGGDDAEDRGGDTSGGRAAESTFPLSREEVLRIAGTSFTTPAEGAGSPCGNRFDSSVSPSVDYLQLAFVANASQGIDVIASTRGPNLNIQRSQLLRRLRVK